MANILIYSNNDKLIAKCTKVLASRHNIHRTMALKPNCNVDIIIVDTCLLDNQNRLLNEIARHPSRFLLIGSQWPEEKQVSAILHAASGYYDTAEPDILLHKAIESILQGDIWVQRHLVPKVIQILIDTRQPTTKTEQQSTAAELLKTLSNRELDVANMITTGENNKQIAQNLNISERTVKAHLTSIFKKLNVSDRLHLAILLKE